MSATLTRARAAALRGALLGYFDSSRRSLPWRDETDPYRILVSEVMLQQTRVETVRDYYGKWLERFPDIEALAAADLDDVLQLWAGLGYYRRARNLHRAARFVCESMDGELPTGVAALSALPGVGEYTAGALASIAFGVPAPAVDGNVRRVLARLFDAPEPTRAWLRATATGLLDRHRPGDWNQALMELGATICRPRRPSCDACPIAEWCAAHQAGTEADRPLKSRRAPVRRAMYALAVLYDERHVLMVRRPADGLLGGMLAFPERQIAEAPEAPEAARRLATELGFDAPGAPAGLAVCQHRFTHLHATYLPYAMRAAAASPRADGGNAGRWVDADDARGAALPAAQRRVLASFARARDG